MLDPSSAEDLPGKPLQDAAGEVVGDIDEVFLLPSDGTPAWARVRTGDRAVVVPLIGAEPTGNGVRTAYTRDTILGAPAAEGLDDDSRQALQAHYGITDADVRDDSGFATERPGGRSHGPTSDVRGDGMVPGHP